MDTQRKIELLTNELRNLEIDKDQRHTKASIEPRTNEIGEQSRHLDALARLLTGGETCVAVYWNGNKIFIASNKEKPTYAKNYLKTLRYFANDSSRKNYNKLVVFALEQVYSTIINQAIKLVITKAKKYSSNSKNENNKTLTNFKEFVKNQKNNQNFKYLELSELQEIVDKLFEEIDRVRKEGGYSVANSAWEYLLPFEDTNIIANAIVEKRLEQNLLTTIKKEKLVEYIEGQENVHAEMKVISKLCETAGQLVALQQNSPQYIGITKLACAPCQLTIDIFNKSRYDQSLLRIGGTHGGTYMNWLLPENLSLNEKKELLKKLENTKKRRLKLRETNGEIPGELALPKILSSISSDVVINETNIANDKNILRKLIVDTKKIIGEELNFALETLLEAQKELVLNSSNHFAQEQLKRAKKELLQKLSEFEVEKLCQEQVKVSQLENQFQVQQQTIRPIY